MTESRVYHLGEAWLPDEPATLRFATCLAALLAPCDCVALSGDLGAGKTSFARGLIQAFYPKEQVTSPTFTLVQTYGGGEEGVLLWHADLYRIEAESEFEPLGFEDAMAQGAVALVEWPERAERYLPRDRLRVQLSEKDEGRLVTLSSTDARWQRLIGDEAAAAMGLAKR